MAPGRTVEELTELCRHVVDQEDDDDAPLPQLDADGAPKTIVHPFQVKDRPLMVLNIRVSSFLFFFGLGIADVLLVYSTYGVLKRSPEAHVQGSLSDQNDHYI
jgi:hypothetical protein